MKKYKDEGFWKKNQYFTVYTESTAYRYQIFSYEDTANGLQSMRYVLIPRQQTRQKHRTVRKYNNE